MSDSVAEYPHLVAPLPSNAAGTYPKGLSYLLASNLE